jgi:serine/threonine protein kinase
MAMDKDLRIEPLALETRGFLEDEDWARLLEADPCLAGLTVGGYTLQCPLGRGGTGSAWFARRSDGRYEGTAAVKLLNCGPLDRAGAERFRREATVLARLAHPNIARLIDAGLAAGGQPYLVLEHIVGRHLDRHCDQERLPPSERLALFLQVLSAVEHAHIHLIAHRDLKPSNILVTHDGQVKLLDVGVVKLLESDVTGDPGSLPTERGGLALTPEYAAPEQVSGGPVTTATDVYALGVLLYFLLAGRNPTGDRCRAAAEHIRDVLDTEPVRLSAAMARAGPRGGAELARVAAARATTVDRLERLYRGDLDHILVKALTKNPAERYATATALADDLRRYLKHQPVSAHPDSVGYRLAKFVRRTLSGSFPTLRIQGRGVQPGPSDHGPQPEQSMSVGSLLGSRALLPIVLLSLGLAAGCGGGDSTGPPEPPGAAVAAVEVTPSPIALAVGETAQLAAALSAADGSPLTGRTVTWATNADGVATVSTTGLVTGVAAGNATITASSEGIDGTTTVTVTSAAGILRTWQGGASGKTSDWSTAANWTPAGKPIPLDTVRVPPSSSPAVLSEDVQVGRLIVAGGRVRIGGRRLEIRAP